MINKICISRKGAGCIQLERNKLFIETRDNIEQLQIPALPTPDRKQHGLESAVFQTVPTAK